VQSSNVGTFHCLDKGAETTECPAPRVTASLEGTFCEDRQHARPRHSAQAGWAAGEGGVCASCAVAVMLPELSSPLADRHPTDAQSAGDLRLRQRASLQQAASCQAAFCTVTASKLFRSPDPRHLL
jgi:hypothetical protein